MTQNGVFLALSIWTCLCFRDVNGLVVGVKVKSSFLGSTCLERLVDDRHRSSTLTMRKQKASDRRTRRLQRGDDSALQLPAREFMGSMTRSPMQQEGAWSQKTLAAMPATAAPEVATSTSGEKPVSGGRGRSRKRSTLYNSLASYHDKFFSMLTAEYRAEEDEVLGRIKASLEEPLGLESAGYALYDLYPERRGNLFTDEVYRLVKATDATTSYAPTTTSNTSLLSSESPTLCFPPNHKFGTNDVILLTLQPGGSGDFFDPISLPTSEEAVSVEGRVLNTGPNYLDVALSRGAFETAFGPAPNNKDGPKGDPGLRLRVDRFFSNVPYMRMVAAINQITSIPQRRNVVNQDGLGNKEGRASNPYEDIRMDELLRDIILSTYSFNDPSSPLYRDAEACNIRDLSKNIAKPPMSTSPKLAQEFVSFIQSNLQGKFSPFNGPQLTAIEAALSRRLTLIQGPPGSGKTTVAAAIGHGFVHQCRQISPNAKVLACAFSNVGADNVAEALIRLNLKVVRIGKASAVSKNLWDYTLDAAIDKDPAAQKALRDAAAATTELASVQRAQKQRGGRKKFANGAEGERFARDAATLAVTASIKACNIAATKALREADVIVTTSTGASDPRLLAACGLATNEEDMGEEGKQAPQSPAQKLQGGRPSKPLSDSSDGLIRTTAPDRRPPLSLPFVLVDEACQSVEPATLIPLTASNSCRSLVLLGDPCQLPPTVRSTTDSPLSVSLMERLSSTIPEPVIVTAKADSSLKDDSCLNALPIRQARSLVQAWGASEEEARQRVSYRKQFAGSLLLSVQYRMHPSIAAFSSAIFYDGLLSTPSFLAGLRELPTTLSHVLPCEKCGATSVRMVNVGGRTNERRRATKNVARTVFGSANVLLSPEEQTTYRNEAEALRVVDIVKQMFRRYEASDDTFPTSIGVVTPYNGQVKLIKSLLASDEEMVSLTQKLTVPIEVNSVDGYQGRERDLIIFSAVRSNRAGNLGFLHDWRRMNVALTRARTALIVVGDLETLVEGDKHWAAFGKWCQGVRCIVENSELQ